jgi:hypothetical protein
LPFEDVREATEEQNIYTPRARAIMKQETSMIRCRDEFSLIWREIDGAEEEKNMCQSHLGFGTEDQGHAENFMHFLEMR